MGPLTDRSDRGRVRTNCADPPPAGLLAGIDQFNRRAFFDCHETLEAIWLAEAGPVRRLYQGILQIGVAFYHLERGNYRGAVGLLESGLRWLAELPPVCQTVDLASLIDRAGAARAALQALGPDRCRAFDNRLIPTIRCLPPADTPPP